MEGENQAQILLYKGNYSTLRPYERIQNGFAENLRESGQLNILAQITDEYISKVNNLLKDNKKIISQVDLEFKIVNKKKNKK